LEVPALFFCLGAHLRVSEQHEGEQTGRAVHDQERHDSGEVSQGPAERLPTLHNGTSGRIIFKLTLL
jgi:hypothetical protein